MIKEYIKVQLNELIPHARNPRKNDSAVEAVSKSIKETGYITPIIVDEKNEILCGHTRAKSLKKLGHSEVEVLKVTGLTDEQKKRYRILDNKTGEVAEWDFEILQEDFKLDELVDLWFDMQNISFEDKNKEIDVNKFDDQMKIVLNYTSDEYWQVIKQLKDIAQTPEGAVWKLLGNA